MTKAMEDWVTEVHRKRGYPPNPDWAVQADYYIREFVRTVNERTPYRSLNCLEDCAMAFDAVCRELLGDE